MLQCSAWLSNFLGSYFILKCTENNTKLQGHGDNLENVIYLGQGGIVYLIKKDTQYDIFLSSKYQSDHFFSCPRCP